ncbi:MAG: FkbM family methyltransferase [Desulfurococcaceae archaeon]
MNKSICGTSQFKIKVYRLISNLYMHFGLRYLTISAKLYNKDLFFYIPTMFGEGILDNFEHVLVDCDYYKLSDFIPRRGHIILDIGAFIGFYSISSSMLTCIEGMVYSIEPNREVLPWLYINMYINKAQNIRILPVAICPESGFKSLYIANYPAISSLSRDYVEQFDHDFKTIEVKCVKLSNILKLLGYVDILKMDIEGLELDVLKESASELWRTRKIVIETHPGAIDPSEVELYLVKAGFRKIVTYTSSEMLNQVILYGLK